MSFAELGLSDEVLRAVSDAGYTDPTPIQKTAIPQILVGRDVLGCAQTGTGKTASFTLPMIDILASGRARARMPRTLILEPTRELATQVAENFDIYGKYNNLTKALIIGGESMEEQNKMLDKGVDVLIATPGRLLDLFERGGVLLNDVKLLVIDEADRMLDMGFIPDVTKIVSVLSKIRQTLMFSATIPTEIRELSNTFLMNPKEIRTTPTATSSQNIEQYLVMLGTSDKDDFKALNMEKRECLRQLIRQGNVKNALIFCNRKRDVDILHKSFQKHGFNSATLHGDMTQPARTETMERFKSNEISLLVCSDVAARGLDIENLSHVFNFDVPTHAEDYVHRIGRTGRAGKTGKAFTIATVQEKKLVSAITRLTGQKIPIFSLSRSKVKENSGETGTVKDKPTNKRKLNSVPPRTELEKNKRGANNSEQDKPVIGMGDHIPAFLRRP